MKLEHEKLFSNCAFNYNLRRYTAGSDGGQDPPRAAERAAGGRIAAGAWQGLTLVPISAQLKLTLPISAQLRLTSSPIHPKSIRGCGPEVLKLTSNGSDMVPKVLKVEL
jgi:hypothetical protein